MLNEKEDLKSFIEEQIKKTGFITEIDTIEEVEVKGWDYVSPYEYLDRDENKWREMDIVSFKCFPDIIGEAQYRLCADMIIECKKSVDHAWIFLVRPKSAENCIRNIFDIDCFDSFGIVRNLSLGALPSSGALPLEREIGRDLNLRVSDETIEKLSSYFDPFFELSNLKDFRELDLIKKGNFKYFMSGRVGLYGKEIKISKQGTQSNISQIFRSLVTVNKALSYVELMDYTEQCNNLKTLLNLNAIQRQSFLVTIEILIPVVVFNGHLYSWDKKSGVKEQNMILARSLYKSSQYHCRRLVPVVKIEYFKNFLDLLDRDLNQIYQAIIDGIDMVDQQTKILVNSISEHTT